MTEERYSLLHYFNRLGSRVVPELRYAGGDAALWRQRLRDKVLELLGPFPDRVEPEVQTEWVVAEDGLVKEKVSFRSEASASIPAIVMKRTDLDPGLRHKTLICLHGHGPFGKMSVVGARLSPKHSEVIAKYNYDYALQFARRGYVTIAPDMRNFGERHDPGLYPGRDPCNVHFIRGLLMGIPLIALNIWDVMNTVDYAASRPDVDAERIGCLGLSFGGTMTMHAAGLDARIKAACISCAVTTYEQYAIRQGNFCGSQFIPGIYRYADIADLTGLIAPRPLVIESGVYDDGFPIDAAIRAHRHIEAIYAAFGAEDRLVIDTFEGGHEFSGRKAFAFFDRWL